MTETTTLPSPAGRQDWLIDLCERGWLPDALVRHGMRQFMRQRLRDEGAEDSELAGRRLQALLQDLRSSPIAIATDAANEQHYELPPAFFAAHLGPHLKYSCCLYPQGSESLAAAERAMLECYVQRAGLADGQDILELGCGWVRCRYGWQSVFRSRVSRPFPIPMASVNSSRPARRSVACRTSGSSLAISWALNFRKKAVSIAWFP